MRVLPRAAECQTAPLQSDPMQGSAPSLWLLTGSGRRFPTAEPRSHLEPMVSEAFVAPCPGRQVAARCGRQQITSKP